MTIGRKLYLTFGAVLAMVVMLFLVTFIAVRREHNAKASATQALQLAEAMDKIKFQMMQNRLHLSNYLLSGDTQEVERMNEGIRSLADKIRLAEELTASDQQHSALDQASQSELGWANEFAGQLVKKRRDVDAGNATVAELQIFYLQKDGNAWIKSTTEQLDIVDHENSKLLEDRRSSDETA